jgi:hypothetical protein
LCYWGNTLCYWGNSINVGVLEALHCCDRLNVQSVVSSRGHLCYNSASEPDLMATVLFIHGTGVRGESYFRTKDLVAQKVRKFLKTYEFRSCQWGDPYGARLNRDGVSIPDYKDSDEVHRAMEDASIARWQLLSHDPLLELRILPRVATVGKAPGFGIWDLLKLLPEHPHVLPILEELFVDTAWKSFTLDVLGDEMWRKTIEPISEKPAVVSDRVARALTAAFEIYIRLNGMPGLAAPQRDRLKNALIQAVGGPALGIGDWFLDRLTNAVRVRRTSVTDYTSPMVGDILRYQARGQEIRNFIREAIDKCDSSVVLLAHSLGGVACVDLLAEKETQFVTHLITAGSQAPYFYELDALVSRMYGSGLGENFRQAWLNFYDLRDFLSYRGADIFPGKVTDAIVNNGQPFPESHGAYWHNDKEFWEPVQKFLGCA